MLDQDLLRRSLLRDALAHRRRETLDRLGGGASRERAPAEAGSTADDAEEVLRVLMVRLWPRIRKRRATPEEQVEFLRGVMGLSILARTEDWRFLDAWNHAFEALDLLTGGCDAELVRQFLIGYEQLLEHHLEEL